MEKDKQPGGKNGTQTSLQTVSANLGANKISDWKNTLTGALDDQRLFCALFVLSIFNFLYIFFNVAFGGDEKDEDCITTSCKCNTNHRVFYTFLLVASFVLWTILHLIVAITDVYHFCNHKTTDQGNSEPNKFWKCCLSLINCCCRCPTMQSMASKLEDYVSNSQKLDRYEFYLWTHYCELYVVGIAKNTENFNLDRVEGIIKEKLYQPPKSSQNNENDKLVLDSTIALRKYHDDWDIHSGLQAFFFFVLKIFQFIAQLFVVPLLLIQMFDTYAFLCFAADNYCSTEAEYNLHLDQTAFTFGFYAALMVSLLSTLMLQWNPWPEVKKKNDTCSKV